MPLEDDYTWVVAKALRGHDLTIESAAARMDLDPQAAAAFCAGGFSKEYAARFAKLLGLNPAALAELPDFEPPAAPPTGVHWLELPFHDGTVNAWLVEKDDTRLLFDTGDRGGACRKALAEAGFTRLDAVLITHGHRDHTGGLAELTKITAAVHGPLPAHGLALTPDADLRFGPLELATLDLTGHADPALGYLIGGLQSPVLVCGDAMFAGSIGGCRDTSAYQLALANLRTALRPLPDETVILPGHGPATTLGAERRHNPFLAGTC
jgi:hydroxyacylglutathione hydrolase